MIKEDENTDEGVKIGTLYIVSTPIGNDEDITLRALRVLKNCDVVVCEEPKIGARMLHKLNLNQNMELLNEQNETTKTLEIISLLESGSNICLVSDCGTPVFADPGLILVKQAIKKDIKIVVVPGATSIMTAVVRSGFSLNQFVFAGFLSRIKDERIAQLRRLKDESKTIVLLETPYRLMPLLDAAAMVLPNRQVYIGCNLTMPFETHHYGTFTELHAKFAEVKFKGEFVIVFEGAPGLTEEAEAEGHQSERKVIKSSGSSSDYSDRPRRSDSYGDRPQGARRSFGDRGSDGDDRRSDSGRRPEGGSGRKFGFSDRPEGERRSFGNRSSEGDDRRSGFHKRPEGDRKPYGDRRSDSGGRPESPRRSFSDRSSENEGSSDSGERQEGGRRPGFIKRPEGGRKPWVDKGADSGDRPEGGRRPFGGGRPDGDRRPGFIKRPEGGRKPWIDKGADSGDRQEGGRRPFGGGRPEGGGRPVGRWNSDSPSRDRSENRGEGRDFDRKPRDFKRSDDKKFEGKKRDDWGSKDKGFKKPFKKHSNDDRSAKRGSKGRPPKR